MAYTVRQRQPRPVRFRVGTFVFLLGLAAVAWLLTRARMLGMDAGPGSDPGTLGSYVVSWVVMMGAMMFPSIVPMAIAFRVVLRRGGDRGWLDRAVSWWLFLGGYLLTWTVFGLVAYLLYEGMRSFSIPALSWHRRGPYLAGGVLLAAAAYQLTPTKDACLRRCRSPLEFVFARWREGPAGALRLGVVHGAWCVGCCWGLMAALFALGVMSLTWMLAIAGLIAIEKLLPWRDLANRLVAATLLALALGVSLLPHQVPGFTLPDSPQANTAMQTMSGPQSVENVRPSDGMAR